MKEGDWMKYIKRLISVFTVMVFSIVMTACGSVPKNGSESSSSSQTQSAESTDSDLDQLIIVK